MSGKFASLAAGLPANGLASTSFPRPELALAKRAACSALRPLFLSCNPTATNAVIAATRPTEKAIVTTSPDVVSELSRFMQTSADDVEVKQMIPGAQDAIRVVVAVQVVLPPEVEQIEVDFVLVVEQMRLVVLVPVVVLPVVVELVVESEVVEEAVVDEAVVDEAVEAVVEPTQILDVSDVLECSAYQLLKLWNPSSL